MTNVANKEKSKIFETVLSSPGMHEKCKIVLLLSRQNILLLSRLIETGLLTDQQNFKDEIISAFPHRAFGIAGRRAGDRTLDRAGAARE